MATRTVHVRNVPEGIWKNAKQNAIASGMTLRAFVIQLLKTGQSLETPALETPSLETTPPVPVMALAPEPKYALGSLRLLDPKSNPLPLKNPTLALPLFPPASQPVTPWGRVELDLLGL